MKWTAVDSSENHNPLLSGIDQKIVAAFERISQALRTLAWRTGKSLSLNPAQTQVIVFLHEHPRLSSKISTLAKEFGISNATMSDTIRLLEGRQLICKTYAVPGSKTFALSLSTKGKEIAIHASSYAQALQEALASLPLADHEQLLGSLSNIVLGLYQQGISPVQRMCQTCKFHDQINGEAYCHLLNQSLKKAEIQVDCPDHIQLQSYHKPFR